MGIEVILIIAGCMFMLLSALTPGTGVEVPPVFAVLRLISIKGIAVADVAIPENEMRLIVTRLPCAPVIVKKSVALAATARLLMAAKKDAFCGGTLVLSTAIRRLPEV